MKDNLLALLAQLDCGNRSCYFANNKSGQRTNSGCDCLKELPLELRMALVKFWRARPGEMTVTREHYVRYVRYLEEHVNEVKAKNKRLYDALQRLVVETDYSCSDAFRNACKALDAFEEADNG